MEKYIKHEISLHYTKQGTFFSRTTCEFVIIALR